MKGDTRSMKKSIFKGLTVLSVMVIVLCCIKDTNVKADRSRTLAGDEYEFTGDEKYTFDQKSSRGKTNSYVSNSFGTFSISGDFENTGEISPGIKAIDVKSGNIKLKYEFDLSKLIPDTNGWNLYEDSAEEVNGIDMDEDVDYGAIIIQTSFDGVKWSTDKFLTNVFVVNSVLANDIYETSNIQLINGCYYRVIVAYEERKIAEPTEVLFVSIDNYVYRRYAEVYTFYAVNLEENKNATSPNDIPRKEIGVKIKTGKDTGYSGNEAIDAKDPHLGWDIGTFVINGYTRETIDATGNPVFLKNLGNKVTLWFNLKQNIDCLNGNKDYTITSKNGAYDQYFEVPKTDFKRGTLIIRFTDHEGKKTNPIIYTNYLEANTRTGAYTQVELFEEGDYEVALDYSVTDSSSLISSTNDYRIFFKFSIRNGNCMVFPFENNTEKELADNSITATGFKLDMAKSRYLTIDVKRSVLNKNNGIYTEDIRFNRPAKDGDIYNEEGIYKFNVKNTYTGENTEKTIYVGTSPIYVALAKNTLSLTEINEKLSEGGELDDYGNIIMPVIEPEITELEVTEAPKTEVSNDETNNSGMPKTDNNKEKETTKENTNVGNDQGDDKGESGSFPIVLIVVIAVLLSAAGAFAWYYFKKIRSKTDGTVAIVAPESVIEEIKKAEDVSENAEGKNSEENNIE